MAYLVKPFIPDGEDEASKSLALIESIESANLPYPADTDEPFPVCSACDTIHDPLECPEMDRRKLVVAIAMLQRAGYQVVGPQFIMR